MRNREKQILKQRHEEFKKNLKTLYDYFDKQYPGWREGPDSDYIKHKINRLAKMQQKNKNKKKQRILKKEYYHPLNWPFTVDEVILVQTSKIYVSIIVKHNGLKEYALNGLAADGLRLKLAHDVGIAVKGKSVGPFIQEGLKL